jgi:hypothetical protein
MKKITLKQIEQALARGYTHRENSKKIFEAIEQMDEKGIEQISNFLKDLKNNKDR